MVDKGIELGTSRVIPVESLEKRPTEFIPTQSEWSANNRELIVAQSVGNAGAAELFKVPIGRSFFITTIQMSHLNNTGLGAQQWGAIVVEGLGRGNTILAEIRSLDGQNQTLALSFPMPIKVGAGSLITVEAAAIADNICTATITGWLE